MPEPRHALWAYGVLEGDAPQPRGVRGVDTEHDVELVRHAGLAAAVSRVALERFGPAALHRSLEHLSTLEEIARGHASVLDELRRTGTVTPFGLCTLFAGAASVRVMLEHEHAQLSGTLRRLRGMAEWGVKAYVAADGAPATPAPASGTEYLARRRTARDGAASLNDAVDAVHAQLARRAARAVRNAGREPRMVLNASYLLADDDAGSFSALVASLSGQDGLALELTGPWPAYHFSAP
jgi:hypothetical protein